MLIAARLVPPLDAEDIDENDLARKRITSRMPEVDLAEVLADMDQRVGLTNLAASPRRTSEPRP